ncbi:hypothetical protein GCM10011501_10600 [Thalassotalea profundi]|uniref:Uncharacterized protein n=1 Tax=Thalassotalea profundi TaxID=2036687 RepID=A0ABQ3IHE8_9GAMM|nr:hypothetical protein GCM10011501_10600 [Thalassotalea profundi]
MASKAETPKTAAIATVATPNNSPYIIHNVFLIPIDMPSDIASVMHMPGVILTRKNVGIKSVINARSIKVTTYI